VNLNYFFANLFKGWDGEINPNAHFCKNLAHHGRNNMRNSKRTNDDNATMRSFRQNAAALLALLTLAGAARSALAAEAEASERGDAVPFVVVRADDATPAEVTAANELAAYLGKMTGRMFPILAEAEAWIPWPGPAIYVGPTAFARENGVDCAALGAEEWALKSVDRKLVVAGGRPRGTLYAAYRLLEDHYGVRWWTPWEETAPAIADFKLPSVDLRGKPAFALRCFTVVGPGGPHGQGGGPWCARNRLNNNGSYNQLSKEYGGELGFGLPYHVHTLNHYVPAGEHYDKHPEWFALVNGKRAHGAHNTYNLCLTNPELRRFMLERLRGYIAESRAAAARAGRPAPVMFDVSRNEAASCECPDCKALAEREGSEAGPLLELVNYLADNIREQYPDVFIHTLAYCETQKPPKTIKARDNVIVQMADDYSFHGKPVTDPANTPFRETLLGWLPVCKNLHMWRYGISYGPYGGGPMATAHAYAADMRFYAEHGITGVFQEHEGGIPGDLRDMKLWILAKLMEDPSREYETLLKDFTDGYYGAAGPVIREYLAALQSAQEAGTSPTGFSAPLHLTHLDVPFLVKAHGLFDDAEKLVAGDPVLLRRVRHARLSLDRATLALFNNLQRNWDGPGAMPLDREAIAARARDAWLTVLGARFPPGLELDWSKCPPHGWFVEANMRKDAVEGELAALLQPRAEAALPERFRHLPPGTVWDYTPRDFRVSGGKAPTTPDPDAETGLTARMELSDAEGTHFSLRRQPLPITWGVFDLRQKLPMFWEAAKLHAGAGGETVTYYGTDYMKGAAGIVASADIRPEDVPGPGYHWYKLPAVPLGDGGRYVYFHHLFFWCPVIQCDLDIPANKRDGAFEIYARIKFEGPDFPHGDPAHKNAICVERIVAVKGAAAN